MGEEKPIAFASRRLMAAEQNYSHLDKEALALMFGITNFNNISGVDLSRQSLTTSPCWDY